ncbi:MAG: methyl-accepting chemotaxis protein, partial [Rhodospirillales bacterium]|nr:methyl-accepting chemotaxis protein [Rhodospirillales bacterium]
MRKSNRRGMSLRFRVMLMVTAATSVILALAIAIFVHQSHADNRAALLVRGNLLAALQADALALPLWDFNTQQVEALVAALGQDPDFHSAIVKDSSGEVAAEQKTADHGRPFEIQRDIIYGSGDSKKTAGTLILSLSQDRIADELWVKIWYGVGSFLLLMVIMNGATYLALCLITRPLASVTAVMHGLADGKLEVEVPFLERRDEIGSMAAAVQVFKDNAVEKVRLEAEQEAKDREAEEEKHRAMARMADQFETSVGEVVNQVSSAAAEMQSSSEAMSATAEETTRQASAVAAASEQASANVQTVASAAEELSSSIAEISRQVTQASQIASAAVTEAERTNVKVQGLATAANK